MKYFDDLDLSSGLGRFIHAVSWPIRKFYITVPLIALIYVTPIFFDAKPTQVHVWYKDKTIDIAEKIAASKTYISAKNKIKSWIGAKTDEYDMSEKGAKKGAQQRGIDTLVEMPKPRTKSFRRKGFDSNGDVITKVEIEVEGLADNDRYSGDVEVVYGEVVETDMQNRASTIKEEIKEITVNSDEPIVIKPIAQKLPLVYLQTPKDIVGKAVINNANELKIGEVYILLYGIYVNPKTTQGMKAKTFLETKTKDKEVKCSIVAYTYQNVATAICFVGNENLNKALVDMDLTKNVAL